MEIINHITGACGEPHLNISIILGITIVFFIIKKYELRKN
jgi:hypothetical protein